MSEVGAASAEVRHVRRSVRNFLLDGRLQLRLAAYLVAVAAALAAGLGWLLWRAWSEASRLVALADPDVTDALAAQLAEEDRLRILLVAGGLVVVLAALALLAVVVTHRIAGPAYALGRACQRVGEGDLAAPRPLRDGDLLVDLADDVAAMISALRAREEAERHALLGALSRLAGQGDPEATAALQRLVAEKDARLGGPERSGR
jgi:methyl-accepting chemotaxis protein